jgi:hypothetical protein
MYQTLKRAVLTDSQLWIPVIVLILGVLLLVRLS